MDFLFGKDVVEQSSSNGQGRLSLLLLVSSDRAVGDGGMAKSFMMSTPLLMRLSTSKVGN